MVLLRSILPVVIVAIVGTNALWVPPGRRDIVWVAPDGDGTVCTKAEPCSSFAAAGALLKDNGVLHFGAGEYTVTEHVSTAAKNVTVEGSGSERTILYVDALGDSNAVFELTAHDLRDTGSGTIVNRMQVISFSGLTMTTAAGGCLGQNTALVTFPNWHGQDGGGQRGLLSFEDVVIRDVSPCTNQSSCSAMELISLVSVMNNNRDEFITFSLENVAFMRLSNFVVVSRVDRPTEIRLANLVVSGLVATKLQTCHVDRSSETHYPILGTWWFAVDSEHSVVGAEVSDMEALGPVLLFYPNVGDLTLTKGRSLTIADSVFDSITFEGVLVGFRELAMVYGKYQILVSNVSFTRNRMLVYGDETRYINSAILNLGGTYSYAYDAQLVDIRLTNVTFTDNGGAKVDDPSQYTALYYHIRMVNACVKYFSAENPEPDSSVAQTHVYWSGGRIQGNGGEIDLSDGYVSRVAYSVLDQCSSNGVSKTLPGSAAIDGLDVSQHLVTTNQPGVFVFANSNVTLSRCSFQQIQKDDQLTGKTPAAVVKIASSVQFLLNRVVCSDNYLVDCLHVTKSAGAVVESTFSGNTGLLAGAAYVYQDPLDKTQVVDPVVGFTNTTFSSNAVAGWLSRDPQEPYVYRQSHITCGPGADVPGETLVALGPGTVFSDNIKAAAGCADIKCSPPLNC